MDVSRETIHSILFYYIKSFFPFLLCQMTFDVGGISVGINFSNSGLYLRELGDVREKHLNSMIALNKSNLY